MYYRWTLAIFIFSFVMGGCVSTLREPHPAGTAEQIPHSAPYPPSTVITGIAWAFPGFATAYGSDIWPLTWGVDGNLYGAWGDGGGFDGGGSPAEVETNAGRVSLGFARISGIPTADNPASITGRNVWGRHDGSFCPASNAPCAENQATFGGKVASMISVGGVLYGTGELWTADNCAGSCEPTQAGGAGPLPALVWSSDQSKTWQIAPWASMSDPFGGWFLNFGQDNAGALDSFVYVYYMRADPDKDIYLKRVPRAKLTSDPATWGTYTYLTGVDARGNPRSWSTLETDAAPIFTDPNFVAGPSVVYDAAIGRFLLTVGHNPAAAADIDAWSAGQVGLFEAPHPWGPWATIGYYDDWGNLGRTAGDYLGLTMPSKWISSDGKVLWGVFSGVGPNTAAGRTHLLDSFNLAQATLKVSSVVPTLTAPAANTQLAPGQRVTVHGTGPGLHWAISRPADGRPPFATGTGARFTFTVPDDSTPTQSIRVKLTSSGGVDVYRDYGIRPAVGLRREGVGIGLLGFWVLDEGEGLTVADSSGHNRIATLVGGPTWRNDAKFGGSALDFTPSANQVQVKGTENLNNLYSTGMTLSAWINPRSAGGGGAGRIVDKDDGNVGWFLSMDGPNSLTFTVEQAIGGVASRSSTPSIALNTWQHVAMTWDGSASGSNAHVYINGVLADGASTDGTGPMLEDSSAPVGIGNRLADAARGFDGGLSGVRIYGRVLGAAEIHDLASGFSIDSVSTNNSAKYSVVTAQSGSLAYQDRSERVCSISAGLDGKPMIYGADDDRSEAAAAYLQITVDHSATIYVAFSTHAAQIPAWLSEPSWSLANETFATTDAGACTPRVVYQRSVAAGETILGGNRAWPATGAGYSNYVVVLAP